MIFHLCDGRVRIHLEFHGLDFIWKEGTNAR